MKCELCKVKIKESFLGKIKGTVIKEIGKKKYHYICSDCQKKFNNDKKNIMKELGLVKI